MQVRADREDQSIHRKVKADTQSGLKAGIMVQWQSYVIQKGQEQNHTPGNGEFLVTGQAGTAWLGLVCGKGPQC